MPLTPEELQELEALKAEVAKVQDPNRITTREQHLARVEEMDRGGLEAGPWYMDLAKEVLNPVDALATFLTGPVKVGAKAAGSLFREGAEQTGGRLLRSAAEQQQAIDLLKNPTQLEPYARGLIDEAATKMGGRIGEKEAAYQAMLRGKTGQINPDLVAEVMPNYAKRLAARRGTEKVPDAFGGAVEQLLTSGPVEVSAKNLTRLKRVGDKLKYPKPTDALDPTAAPRIKNASRVSDVAREQIYENVPQSKEALAAMGKDIRLRNFLTKRAQKNPVSTIQAPTGSLKESVLAQVDEATGSSLRQAGDRLQQAKKDLVDPMEFLRPLQAPAEAAKLGKRALIQTGAALQPAASRLGSLPGVATATDQAAFGTAKMVADPTEVGTSAPNWTEQDELELQELKNTIKALQGS